MCGICGVVYSDPERSVDPEMLSRMTDTLIHRGPDGRGFYRKPGVGLGIRRLSIIDLETGDQPISNEDGTITVICNGEIYNFKELRKELEASGHTFRTKSDAEVIVHLYEEHGVDCLKHLRGMFGFAIWDQPRRRLMLARDRLGIKPLCYALEPDALYFGSELKAILKSGQIQRDIDPRAFRDLFTFGFPLAPTTLFLKIRRLLPGQFLLYQKGDMSLHRYWTPSFPRIGEKVPERSEREWAEGLKEKLTDAVKIHLRSDVPLGAFLSAGLDSSAIVALMCKLTDQPVQTFSAAFENPAFDEISHQKILTDFPGFSLKNERVICKTADADLIRKAVWHREDPSSMTTTVPRMMLSELAYSKNIKVALLGEGSDEIFGGYHWFKTEKIARMVKRLPPGIPELISQIPFVKKKRSVFSNLLGAPLDMNLTRYSYMMHHTLFNEGIFSEELRQRISSEPQDQLDSGLPGEFRKWHPFHQLQYFELTVRLPDLIIRNVDSSSMANSVEARVPFLDHELVEFCSEIPIHLKMRRFREKHILRQAMVDLLPQEILFRKKNPMLAPSQEWLQNLPDFAQDLLSEERITEKGYFDPVVVSRLRKNIQEQNSFDREPLMAILQVQMWDDLFRSPDSPQL